MKLTPVEEAEGLAIFATTASEEDSVQAMLLSVFPFAVNELFRVVEQLVGIVRLPELELVLTLEAGLTYTVVAEEVAEELPLLTVTVTA
jgi:hypothetical protein